MEAEEQHMGLEKVLSQKAIAMSSSFPCQICVVGFLCGVCLTSLFLAGLTSFGSFEFGGMSFGSISAPILPSNSSSTILNLVTKGDCSKSKPTTVERDVYLEDKGGCCDEEKVSSLYSSWTALLNESQGPLLSSRSSVPKAPHLESCKMKAQINERLDMHVDNETFPPWTLWRGSLDMYPTAMEDEQLKNLRLQDISEGAYPPWDRMI